MDKEGWISRGWYIPFRAIEGPQSCWEEAGNPFLHCVEADSDKAHEVRAAMASIAPPPTSSPKPAAPPTKSSNVYPTTDSTTGIDWHARPNPAEFSSRQKAISKAALWFKLTRTQQFSGAKLALLIGGERSSLVQGETLQGGTWDEILWMTIRGP